MPNVVEFGQRRLLIVFGVMMAALLQTLDATIVNVALPTIEGNVGASIDEGTWIITGYIISNVVVIPLAPYLMARLGRRQYYAICIAGFTAASFLCGTAGTLGALIFYRVVQGAFGGGLIATSQVILRDTFPKEQLGTSSGIFALALTVGPALGPTLGGFLTDNFSWQWVFDINIVPGVIALAIILTTLRNPADPKRMPFDSVGVALLAIGLGSVQFVLDEGERYDWFSDGRILFATTTAVLGLAAFVYWELRGTKTPIVDLRIFRYRVVQLGVPCAIMIGVVLFGPIVVLPQYVQEVLGFTTIMSGFLILSRALPVIILTPLIGRFVQKVWPPILLFIGMGLSAVSLAMIASRMTTGSDFGSFQFYLVLSGVGQSMFLVPLLVTMLGSVAPADSPKVSSFIALSVQLGGSIASALLITIFDRRMFYHADVYRGLSTLANPEVQHLFAQGATAAKLQAAVTLQAMNAGFADSIYAIVPVAIVAAVVVLTFRFARSVG
jgi:MFS transporter, DHA2 family, multidrug resistance protein